MRECWRWFGPKDAVGLHEVRQTGAEGIVTALHEVPMGEPWPALDIESRRDAVAAAGLAWTVVESVPVSEAIKTREGPYRAHLDAWRTTLRRLAAAGMQVVCYNFMPVLDWTRTRLDWPTREGGTALRFDMTELAAFDRHVLRRAGAADAYGDDVAASADALGHAWSETERERLTATLIAGLPGTDLHHDAASFAKALDVYDTIDATSLRSNLKDFLNEVAPVAEECGIRLAIHPDDPPQPILGLPRVVSTAQDLHWLFESVASSANGLTLCTGSLGSRRDNDLPAVARNFADRIHFAHLRNVAVEDDGSFIESDHLAGDVDMVAVIEAILNEERRRLAAGRADDDIPFRPDHGHILASDRDRRTQPGYPYIGRLRGLAELRGIAAALRAKAA